MNLLRHEAKIHLPEMQTIIILTHKATGKTIEIYDGDVFDVQIAEVIKGERRPD